MNDLNIHGDNIVECERALTLILESFGDSIVDCSLTGNSVACPRFSIKLRNDDAHRTITFFPGFGRWEIDVLSAIYDQGGVLREAADVIVTEVKNNKENLLFALEFCGAIPAGNQAWQRSGRAYSYGMAKIPYLYISELGGYELDANRNRKAARLPNPAVPFSYLSFSNERDTPVFPIFITAPNADDLSRKTYENEFTDLELLNFVKSFILNEDASKTFSSLQEKVLSFVKKRANSSRDNNTLSASQWQLAYEKVQSGESISNFLIEEVKQNWSKKTKSSKLTNKAKCLLNFGKAKGIGLTSTELPLCLFDINERIEFADLLNSIYPNLSCGFVQWIKEDRPLGVCWIMGFKPQGDDARPERGIAPLARMLLGEKHDLLSVVYGPAIVSTWKILENNPRELSNKNGLWEAIFETSDALLIESSTDQRITRKGYTKAHWHHELPKKKTTAFLVPARPVSYRENDVDTAIHILLSHLCGEQVFEGMCNPPGGDWSGVSILSNGNELRWVSLPRVSGPNRKRPDHVFQITIEGEKPVILSIESKEQASKLEKNIGPQLTNYLQNLFGSKANIKRPIGCSNWSQSDISITLSDFRFVSAGAFLSDSIAKNRQVIKKSKTDLNFSVSFDDSGEKCSINIYTKTSIGKKVAQHIESYLTRDDLISLSIVPVRDKKRN